MSLDTFKQEFTRRVNRKKDYRDTFGTKCGQEVLADIYRFCGMHQSPYVPNSSDQTAYKLGLMRVGQYIQKLLNQEPDEIEKIMRLQTLNNQEGIEPYGNTNIR